MSSKNLNGEKVSSSMMIDITELLFEIVGRNRLKSKVASGFEVSADTSLSSNSQSICEELLPDFDLTNITDEDKETVTSILVSYAKACRKYTDLWIVPKKEVPKAKPRNYFNSKVHDYGEEEETVIKVEQVK